MALSIQWLFKRGIAYCTSEVILEFLLTQINLLHERLAFTITLRLYLPDYDQDLVYTLAKHTTISDASEKLINLSLQTSTILFFLVLSANGPQPLFQRELSSYKNNARCWGFGRILRAADKQLAYHLERGCLGAIKFCSLFQISFQR